MGKEIQNISNYNTELVKSRLDSILKKPPDNVHVYGYARQAKNTHRSSACSLQKCSGNLSGEPLAWSEPEEVQVIR